MSYIKLNDPCATNAENFFDHMKRETRERLMHDASMAMIFATSQKEHYEAERLYKALKCE